MNIKSLLLGSAAALAVVSGAQAADAVVAAEPEPVEYVKVCDAYGTGYFYIPGTETCLKIGGRVRFDIKAADSYEAHSDIGWRTKSRGEIYMDSASDTEYGPLKTQFVLRNDFDGTYNDGTHTTTKLIAANIQIAGFKLGLADSLYTTFTNYAGDIINDDVVSYGGFEINQIQYNYDAGNGFHASVAVQDDTHGKIVRLHKDGKPFLYPDKTPQYVEDNGRDYAPDFVVGAGYTGETFAFNVVGGYDESVEEGAIKARLDGTFGALNAFVMAAFSSSDERNAFAPGDTYSPWGSWAAWAGLGYQVSDTLKLNAQVSGTDNSTFSAALNAKWFPVENLLIQPEITYTSWNLDHTDYNFHGARHGNSPDQWNAMVRFQRTF